MSKRKHDKINDRKQPVRKKIHLSVDISNKSINSLSNTDDDIEIFDVPDLSGFNRNEIESTIYEAIQRNNISNAKAKYLIRKMLKHPHVVEWFRNIFNSEKPEFNLLYEPRITRSSKVKVGESEDSVFNGLDANLIGRLLLSAPTINSFEFDNDDNNDNDYSPESENSVDSDQSSLTSDIGRNKPKQIMLSPYHTRSKATLNDLQVDFLDDSFPEFEEEEEDHIFETQDLVHPSFCLDEIENLIDMDVDEKQYEEFKKSLFTDDIKNDDAEDDPEFDVLAQIDDLDEDIFDDFRDDRSVKIPRSELWALLKDNNLVKGNGSSSTNKKTITMLCEDEEISYNEPCTNIKDMLLEMAFTDEQRERLSRQIIMFYQQLATAFVMIYDQQHLKQIIDAQLSFYFRMTSNISENSDISVFNPPNRCVVEKILFNYKGISYIPTSRFTNSTLFRKIDFPKCVMATLLCSSAFPYVQLLPSSFKLHNYIPLDFFRQIPFLPSEDKLLTMGIIQFSHQCHKMLKLIKKYLFPIRSTDQLRNRKTNIIRRQKELNHKESELFAELLQCSGYLQINKKNQIKVHSDLAKLPVHFIPIWQRKDEWQFLPDTYKLFLTKTVPNIMYNLHLCTKEEWARSNRIANNRKTYPTKEFQYCNWSSLPWELEKVDFVKNENKQNYVKTVLRKVVNKKSFPQYEIPKNSQLREFLKKWNCNCDKKELTKNKIEKISHSRSFNFMKKSIKRAKYFFLKYSFKKEQKKLQTEQSYAHYFRNDEMAKLFPNTVFKSRLEEIINTKDSKNVRLQRFQNKYRGKETDIIDFTYLPFSNKDEDDLVFCRNLLNDLRNSLNTEAYEQCLNRINEFKLIAKDENFDESVLELMKYLMNIVKSQFNNGNIYEDFLSLLTFKQAVKLGCEIDWRTVRNINQVFSMIKSLNLTHKRRFWVRLSSLLNKSGEGIHAMGKVIQHLYASVKNNGYAQSLIAPLLNCWEIPFPNYPQAFSNYDLLSSNSSLVEFCKTSEKDSWDYCTELSEQPKSSCVCSCHDSHNNNVNNTTTKESATIRHCIKCNLKAYNGCIYIDESKIHKRLVTLNLPSAFKPPTCSKKDNLGDDNIKITQKVDHATSMSVLEFLKTKNAPVKQLHNRCISIKETKNLEIVEKPNENQQNSQWIVIPNANTLPYMHVLEDEEAAMDADVFRKIKGHKSTCDSQPKMNLQIPKFESTVNFQCNNSSQVWTDDDNLLLMKVCQKHGPTSSTFQYLKGAHFFDRSLEQIEDQFNYLFQQVLEYQQQS